METQSTRISKYVIEEIGKIAEGIGNPTDDTAMRHVIAEYKRLKVENELLKTKLDESEGIIRGFNSDLNDCFVTINQKDARIKELEWKLGKYEGDKE